MMISVKEVQKLARLRTRRQLLMFLAAHAKGSWFTTRGELGAIVGLGERHANLVLRDLERKRFLVREWRGNPNDRGLFRPRTHLDPPGSNHLDPPGSNHLDPPGSNHTTLVNLTRSDPSVLDQNPGGTADGRTELVDQGVRELVLELWPAVPVDVIPSCLARLAPLAMTSAELAKYLRAGHAGTDPCFHGLAGADYPFAALCTVKRASVWLKSQRRAQRRRVPRPAHAGGDATLSCAERAELAEAEIRKLRST